MAFAVVALLPFNVWAATLPANNAASVVVAANRVVSYCLRIILFVFLVVSFFLADPVQSALSGIPNPVKNEFRFNFGKVTNKNRIMEQIGGKNYKKA